MLSRALAWAWQSYNFRVIAFDADCSNATLTRFLPGTVLVDVDGDGLVNRWFEEKVVPAILNDSPRVLLDLGAGGERLFRNWSANNDAPSLLAEQGVEICVWHALDPSLDSVSPMLDTMAAMPKVTHLIAFNLGLAKGVHSYRPLDAFEAIQLEQEFIEAARDKPIIKIPPLLDVARLDAADMSFTDAVGDASPLTIFEKMRVNKWLLSVRDQATPWL